MIHAFRILKRKATTFGLRLVPGRLGVRLRANRQWNDYRRRFPISPRRRAHGLPGEMIVTLTSYPPRFSTLSFTLRSLMEQSTPADRIALWIAEDDADKLPSDVTDLIGRGVELHLCADVRSFKKLVFAVETWPDAFLVTTDDDVFYPPEWLAGLAEGFAPAAPTIVCHRAHRIPAFSDGAPPKYVEWDWDVQDERARSPSADLMAVGVGGVLYPPRALHAEVTDRESFTRLCPNADDLWFFWCARRAGTLYKKIGAVFPLLYWDSSQDERLFESNTTANDEQFTRLVEAYGDPTRMKTRTTEPG